MNIIENPLFDHVTTSEEPICYYIGVTEYGYMRIFFSYNEFYTSYDNYDYVVCMNNIGIKTKEFSIVWDNREGDFYFVEK
jgi:hypothetical protein